MKTGLSRRRLGLDSTFISRETTFVGVTGNVKHDLVDLLGLLKLDNIDHRPPFENL